MDESFATRYVNDGFSGGEKKRLEVLQMAVLQPHFAMLDEPDSGLDIDAVRIVSEGVNAVRGANIGILLITHYQRILNYVQPDFVHVHDGRANRPVGRAGTGPGTGDAKATTGCGPTWAWTPASSPTKTRPRPPSRGRPKP